MKVNRSEEDVEIDENLVEQLRENPEAEAISPEEITWESVDMEIMEDADVVNLLLIGQDRREGQGRQRSDSMIICSINKKLDKIILSAVMRDLYVSIPGYSDNRVNVAYQFGGIPLLDKVIEKSPGIHINGNIEVDFKGFIKTLSEVGDLEIELSEEEANYLIINPQLGGLGGHKFP